MIAKASLNYIRASSRKVRDVIRLIKGKDVPEAFAVLTAINKGARVYLTQLLKSAVANAKKKGLQENQLYISNLVANNGPAYKRYRSAPFGRAEQIRRPTSHIDLELEVKAGAIVAAKPKAKKPRLARKKG
jgi:large subunit ribosomal protein L22